MIKNKTGIVKIVSGKRPWYERVLASVFFAAGFYLLFLFYKNINVTFTEDYYISSFKVLSSLIFVFSLGIKYSYTVNHHFDFDLKKYRKFVSVGPFGFGKWQNLKNLNRVSTFVNRQGNCEVNIWDVKNNKYRIAYFYKIEDAVSYGRDLAEKLEIKFLERS